MVAISRIRLTAVALIMLVMATGCSVKHTRVPAPILNLDIDPSFTWSKVETHNLGVLAATVWNEDLNWTEQLLGRQLRDTLVSSELIARTRSLSDRISYHNPFWNVVTATELADSIGWKTYSRLVNSYVANGSLSDDEVQLLDLSLHDRLRYLVVARIEDHQTEEWDQSGDSGGDTDYIAVRAMILDYKIYDLWYQNLVWSGWVQEEQINEGTVAEYEYDEESSFLANLIGSFVTGLAQSKPDVPEYHPMLDASFASLAQNLFPPVPLLHEGSPDHALRCSLCPDLPGKFEFGEQDVTLRLDGEKIYMRWADGSETRLKEKIKDWPGEVRCGFCGSLYSWESEWMTLAADGLPE